MQKVAGSIRASVPQIQKHITDLTVQDQWVRVKATNAAGSSDYSGYVYVSLLIDCTSAPATPSSLGGSSQTLHWNAVPNATNYDIQYWTGSAWADHGSASTTSYSLNFSGIQYVRNRANNSCGSSHYSTWITVY